MFPLRRLPIEEIEEVETGRQEGRETDRQTDREKVKRTKGYDSKRRMEV